MARALEELVRSPTGRLIATRARAMWRLRDFDELLTKILPGAASRTDAILTRKFNPLTGKEFREREITVYLRPDQKLDELVLDMVHELVHATGRPAWDPYDPSLTPASYIRSAIEGEGGEVQAVIIECQVGHELLSQLGRSEAARDRCKEYWDAAGGVVKNRVLQHFYRVGRWHGQLARKLRSQLGRLPLVSPKSPKFFSSTGNAPYPVSLYREYEEINAVACENSRKRLAAIESQGRSPAGSAASFSSSAHPSSTPAGADRAASASTGPGGRGEPVSPVTEANSSAARKLLASRCSEVE